MTISWYFDLFDSDQVRCLKFEAEDIRRESGAFGQDFSNSVLRTWRISFNCIREQNGNAADLLCFMNLVHPEGIPVD